MFETYMAYVLMLAAYGETRASLFLNQVLPVSEPNSPSDPSLLGTTEVEEPLVFDDQQEELVGLRTV